MTDKEQESFSDYYQEDLSLSEIASSKNISRAAVQKTIKNVLEKLDYDENILNIYKKTVKLREICDLLNDKDIKNKIEEILV